MTRHTTTSIRPRGRDKPFAELLRRDGYQVNGHRQPLSAESLKGVVVLVIANPLHERNVKDWSPPNPSAFTQEEITALCAWVDKGGSLFLIVDHRPFPRGGRSWRKPSGQSSTTATCGLGMEGGRARDLRERNRAQGSALTQGVRGDKKVTKVTTFTGSAFRFPKSAIPVLVLAKSESVETKMRRVPIEGWCQDAVLPAGKGRVAVFGEAAMFTAQWPVRSKGRWAMNARCGAKPSTALERDALAESG